MRIKFYNIVAAIVLAAIPGLLSAQPGGGGSPGDNDVPITGIEYLIGAGALIGYRFLRNRKK